MASIAHAVVDWGTSSFRLWTLDEGGAVLGERRSDEGLSVARGRGFETVLESHLAALGVGDGVPVMMCGMVGARSGWVEADYLDAPVRLRAIHKQATVVPASRRAVRILPGIAQPAAGQPDVMRGEETQLLALTASSDRSDWLACMPGTHSKWVVLMDGAVERFTTYMTGELFHLLRTASVIAPAVEGAEPVDPESQAFADGVEAALAAPEQIGNALFQLRAGWLLAAASPTDTLARLSGLLIGLEVAAAVRRFGSTMAPILIAAEPATSLYRRAFGVARVSHLVGQNAEVFVRSGLHAAASAAFGNPHGAAR
jgi:2-dehydro-3-deoxygalactonokinase